MGIYGHSFDNYIESRNDINSIELSIESFTKDYHNYLILEAEIIPFPGNKSEESSDKSSGSKKKANRFIEFLKKIKEWFVKTITFIKEKISGFIRNIINKIQGGIIAKIVNKSMKEINDNLEEDFDIDLEDFELDDELDIPGKETKTESAIVTESITGKVLNRTVKKAVMPVVKAGLTKFTGIDLDSIFHVNSAYELVLLSFIMKDALPAIGETLNAALIKKDMDLTEREITKLANAELNLINKLGIKILGKDIKTKNFNYNDLDEISDDIEKFFDSNFEEEVFKDIINRRGESKAAFWAHYMENMDKNNAKANAEIAISIKNVSCKKLCEYFELNIANGGKTLERLNKATDDCIKLSTEIASKIDIDQLNKLIENLGEFATTEKGTKMIITAYNTLVKMMKICEKGIADKSKVVSTSVRDQTILLQKIATTILTESQKSA